jgi:hypothetical protein
VALVAGGEERSQGRFGLPDDGVVFDEDGFSRRGILSGVRAGETAAPGHRVVLRSRTRDPRPLRARNGRGTGESSGLFRVEAVFSCRALPARRCRIRSW